MEKACIVSQAKLAKRRKEGREGGYLVLSRMYMGGLMDQVPNLYIHMYLATY